jgi:hypothetical protein
LGLQLPDEQAQIASGFKGQFLDFLRLGPLLLCVSVGLLPPHVELREATAHDFANGDETRPQTPQVRGEFVLFYHPSCRLDSLEAEMVEQRLTQVQANRQVGFARQKFQHPANRRIQVNLAEQAG